MAQKRNLEAWELETTGEREHRDPKTPQRRLGSAVWSIKKATSAQPQTELGAAGALSVEWDDLGFLGCDFLYKGLACSSLLPNEALRSAQGHGAGENRVVLCRQGINRFPGRNFPRPAVSG